MDERVKKIDTVRGCETFAKNAENLGRPDLAREAKRRAIEIRAAEFGARSEAENEAIQAIYAYEELLAKKNGKRTRASRTWQMIGRHGIIEAVERAVKRESETQGYTALVEMGLEDFAFEAVVLRHPERFTDEAVTKSRQRMSEWKNP